ncbi:MAG: response regulator [Bacteroidota bacterium]
MEVEILLIEDDLKEAEKTIHVLRKKKLANKLIHLRDGKEANDFIFCEGVFSQRSIYNQPKTILFNIKGWKLNDIKFLNRINSDNRTRDISVVILATKESDQANIVKHKNQIEFQKR